MTGKLKRQIMQRRPFTSVQEEVILSLMRTTDQLTIPLAEVLRRADFSSSQYNILRILRGAGEEGLPCGAISERMVRRDPDVTRLLDRLEKRGFITRARDAADRRVVRAVINAAGLAILDELEEPVNSALKRALAHISPQKLRDAIEVLEELRAGVE